jgi:hypothetical protein
MSIPVNAVRSIGDIDVDAQGNIYSSGSCFNGNVQFSNLNVTAPFSYNQYFVKYNSGGLGIWARFVEDFTLQDPALICDQSGNVYICGSLNGPFMFGNIQTLGPQWVYDFYVSKLDSSGTFLWVREVPHSASITGDATRGKARCIGIYQNYVYFTGLFRGTINWGNNIFTASSGSDDLLLLIYSTNGVLLFGKKAGGTGNDRGDAISLDNQGNSYITGNFSQTAVFDTITVSGTGFVNSFASKLSATTISGIIKQNEVANSYHLNNYPNPFNPGTVISFQVKEPGFVSLKIFDISGREISVLVNEKLSPGIHKIEWNALNIPSGVYFCRLDIANQQSQSKKMVLVK